MIRTAKLIRQALSAEGISSRMVSVRCSPSYRIDVTIRDDGVDHDKVHQICRGQYLTAPHGWLCVYLTSTGRSSWPGLPDDPELPLPAWAKAATP